MNLKNFLNTFLIEKVIDDTYEPLNKGYELAKATGQDLWDISEFGSTNTKQVDQAGLIAWLQRLFPSKYKEIVKQIAANPHILISRDGQVDLTTFGEVNTSPNNK